MNRYQCHKVVEAAKILSIDHVSEGLVLWLETPDHQHVHVTGLGQFARAEAGGYYVRYTDGYESYSPAKAFEEGYTLMPAALTEADAAADLAGTPRPDFESSGPVSA